MMGANAPSWQVGDWWEYRDRVIGPDAGRATRRIEVMALEDFDRIQPAVPCFRVELRTGQGRAVAAWSRQSDLAHVATHIESPPGSVGRTTMGDTWIVHDPPEPWLPWRLEPGHESQDEVQGRGGEEPTARWMRVGEWEEVEVPAGRFRCIRVDTTTAWPTGIERSAIWFCPEVGRPVLEHIRRGRGQILSELVAWGHA